PGRRLELRERALAKLRGRLQQGPCRGCKPGRGLVGKRRCGDDAASVEENGRLHLRGDLGQLGERGLGLGHRGEISLPTMREVFSKFFADRGTHLAAMIAYFALLSFVPLLFLALALLGFAGRADESSFLVTELNKAFPTSSIEGILKVVRSVQT